MKQYDHKRIEKKWQKIWKEKKIYRTADKKGGEKFYILDMFPYPSGEGLHVGHPKGYIATDVISRMKRMQGKNVLHPTGFDAFGLPAENYAIKNKTNPAVAVKKNVARYKKQLEILGFDYDWSREINTTDPNYYRWTQWIFLKMFEKGLAYQSYEPINWCPSCKTGLANEDLEDGKCERCGSVVEKKPMRQWVLKITDYAERLLTDLDKLDWPEHIKEQQRNWIGKSEGAEIKFKIRNIYRGQMSVNHKNCIEVFTTRADTLFGATYLVLSPELSEITSYKHQITNWEEVEKYINETRKKTEIERTAEGKEKTGVELKGIKAINPANGEEIPIFIADYVLPDYGTGAIMAVPAHDERDWQFAKKYNLPIKEVIIGGDISKGAHLGVGKLINSGKFDGMESKEVARAITKFVGGKMTIKYKLRDWVFSRQRYWGEPIPLIHCENCKTKRALLIHGFEGWGENWWFPWMKKQLEERGIKVYAPNLSTSKHPTVESWTKELMPLVKDFGPDDIIIGHSLGSKAALHLLETSKKKIGNVFLVASAIGQVRDEKFWQWIKTDWKDSDADSLHSFWSKMVDYTQVIKSASSITIIRSDDDEIIQKGTHDNLPKEWDIQEWHGFGHFDERDALPELLELIDKKISDGIAGVPEKKLPVKLPKVKYYEPTGTGESPLAAIAKWVNVKCPKCGGQAKRETNTMPQWAGSSWYYLAYIVKKVKSYELTAKDLLDNWLPVNFYIGGAEHATRHLIYARFWHKFLKDIGVVSAYEPFQKLQSVGLIMGEDGRKMSKRWGNVVNPDEMVERFGADALRVYEMFMGPFAQAIAWNTDGLVGTKRFLEKIWRIGVKLKTKSAKLKTTTQNSKLENLTHQTIKKVTEDIETMRFNTAISALMILTNEMDKLEKVSKDDFEILLRLLAPFAPHITEELWNKKKFIHLAPWPKYDVAKIQEATVKIVIQVNGKTRGTLEISRNLAQTEVEKQAAALPEIAKWLVGKSIKKIIFVPARLLNFVVA